MQLVRPDITPCPPFTQDTRLSSAPQNVAHAAVVLVMFILGLNWVLEGLEARW